MTAPDRYFGLVNEERWDELEDIFAPDAELVAMGTRPRRGLGEIRDYYERAFAPYPEHVDRPTRLIVGEGTTVAEIHFEGRTNDGLAIAFDAVDVFDLGKDGRITRLSSWYDSLWVRKLLEGGAPAPGV